MSDLKIVTNNIPRPVVYGYELTDKQKADFDYLDDVDSAAFVIYKGIVYAMDEIMRLPAGSLEYSAGYHGYYCNSAFGGVIFKFSECGDAVTCATSYC